MYTRVAMKTSVKYCATSCWHIWMSSKMNQTREFRATSVDSRVKQLQVLDGGSATELAITFGHSYIEGDALWSARLLIDNKKVIKAMHTSFLGAGADIISTITYQASVPGLMKHLNINKEQACDIITTGARIAVETRDEYWLVCQSKSTHLQKDRPLVAGSLGPYGAHLANGSEYTGDYIDSLSQSELHHFYIPQVKSLLAGGVDLLAFETIPSGKEALAIARILLDLNPTPFVWISFSCKNEENINYGEKLSDTVAELLEFTHVKGIGINCTAPEHVEPLLKSLPVDDFRERGKALVVYPNSGSYSTSEKVWKDPAVHISSYVDQWCRRGANWIGGCCGVKATDIRQIYEKIESTRRSRLGT